MRPALGLLAAALLLAGCASGLAPRAFRIQLVDQHTGRGVPAVELRVNDGRTFVSDSAGVIALLEPDLLGRSTFFRVSSFGYRCVEEWLGAPGTVLRPEPGRGVVLPLLRENVAERYYRITGTGIYRDSRLLGERVPSTSTRERQAPLGIDSAQVERYRGRLFWVWGDALVAGGPIGNLRVTAATSPLPGEGLDPRVGIELDYFTGPRAVRPMVETEHPVVWLSALRTVRGDRGQEHLLATYSKIGPGMQAVEAGLAELDDRTRRFELVDAYPEDAPLTPRGHAFRYRSEGRAWIQYDFDVRSPDDEASVRDLSTYQGFTPLRPGSRIDLGAGALERDAAGRLVWGWKAETPVLSREDWEQLLAGGHVQPREAWRGLVDVETGEPIEPHNGSIRWNAYRRRWVMIRTQRGGASPVGEIYYAEGDTPLGPWAYARKILTHARPAWRVGDLGSSDVETLSFYNPVHHPELDRNGGRQIFFEGTLSELFASGPAVPGYNYNQILYSLDLDDPRLRLPVPVYRVTLRDGTPGYRTLAQARGRARQLAFLAPDRPRRGTVGVREMGLPDSGVRLVLADGGAPTSPEPPLFYCATDDDSPGAIPLYERRRGERWSYSTDPTDASDILCYVWEPPVDFPEAVVLPTAPERPVGAMATSGPGGEVGLLASERDPRRRGTQGPGR